MCGEARVKRDEGYRILVSHKASKVSKLSLWYEKAWKSFRYGNRLAAGRAAIFAKTCSREKCERKIRAEEVWVTIAGKMILIKRGRKFEIRKTLSAKERRGRLKCKKNFLKHRQKYIDDRRQLFIVSEIFLAFGFITYLCARMYNCYVCMYLWFHVLYYIIFVWII